MNLKNVCHMFIAKTLKKVNESDKEYTEFFEIRAEFTDTGVLTLATYKSEQEAISVLKEIAKHYELEGNVYRMPQFFFEPSSDDLPF